MSILIAYFIIGLTFHIGFWTNYNDFKFVQFHIIFGASLFVLLGWPVVIYQMIKRDIKF